MDKRKHRTIMVKILKKISDDNLLQKTLGFKGGTAAYLFYDLPRFSVDFDFDLLNLEKKKEVFERLVKIEVSKRKSSAEYVLKHYLGIPVLVISKRDLATGKLSAFLTRRKFAARDLFDLWFLLSQEVEINPELLEEKTGLSLKEALKEAKIKVKAIKSKQLLQGIGELIEEKQKTWIKQELKKEALFYLDLYLKNL